MAYFEELTLHYNILVIIFKTIKMLMSFMNRATQSRATVTMFQRMNFTRSVRKIVLMQDEPSLGFAGEICFVKPGHAFNDLVPRKAAVFYSDPVAKQFLSTVKVSFVD
jgi:hypothetical protein